MDQQQQELRHAAARAFMESLTHLQQTLQDSEPEPMAESSNPQAVSVQPTDEDSTFDLGSFEQAAADIEQFMQAQPPPPESTHH